MVQDKEESKRPVSWEFKDGLLTVSEKGEMPDYSGTEEVPWIAVRSCKKNCNRRGNYFHWKAEFSNFENLEEVVFPETLKIIGNGAFLNAAVLHRSFCRKVWKGLAGALRELPFSGFFSGKVLLFLKFCI